MSPLLFHYDRPMNDEMSEFLAALLHSSTVTHFLHWSTDSYAKHVALREFYKSIVKLTDELAESYMGKFEQIKKFPEEFHSGKDPVKYLESLKDFVQESREELPQDSEIQNLVDEIADLINSTLYKLRFLK